MACKNVEYLALPTMGSQWAGVHLLHMWTGTAYYVWPCVAHISLHFLRQPVAVQWQSVGSRLAMQAARCRCSRCWTRVAAVLRRFGSHGVLSVHQAVRLKAMAPRRPRLLHAVPAAGVQMAPNCESRMAFRWPVAQLEVVWRLLPVLMVAMLCRALAASFTRWLWCSCG